MLLWAGGTSPRGSSHLPGTSTLWALGAIPAAFPGHWWPAALLGPRPLGSRSLPWLPVRALGSEMPSLPLRIQGEALCFFLLLQWLSFQCANSTPPPATNLDFCLPLALNPHMSGSVPGSVSLSLGHCWFFTLGSGGGAGRGDVSWLGAGGLWSS